MFSWNLIGRMFAGWYGTCRLWGRPIDENPAAFKQRGSSYVMR